MFGEILEINNNRLIVKKNLNEGELNTYVKIVDTNNVFVGEIVSILQDRIELKVMGVLSNNNFVFGVTSKPTLKAKIEALSNEEINILFGLNNYEANKNIYIGKSALYKDLPIVAKVNSLFANHMAVLGNTGSGKSCGMTRILQNIFYKRDSVAKNATIFIVDAYGEYKSAFSMINAVNPELAFKSYSTEMASDDDILQVPLWLLSLDDICLLLGVTSKNQIPIVEKALKLVTVFVKEEESVIKIKNSIIAKALLDIFISGNAPAAIRDQIFSVLTRYNTNELNLDTQIYQPGYTRPLKQCLLIDNTGKIRDTELVIQHLQKYVMDNITLDFPDGTFAYTLKDLLYAFDFALIDEGMLNDDSIYSKNHELRVHLSSIIESDQSKFFEFNTYFDKEDFFFMLTHQNDQKCQVINLNLNNLDDRFAKVIAKIYSKFLFDYAKKKRNDRASEPIHIVLEEAHRYVQNDSDVEILGYNIFERIAKEGRKYAILLNLISQRPSELSQTVFSQISNYLVFKISHPADIDYIKPLIPYVDDEMVEKIKNLQTGHCLIFGSSVNFPTIIKVDMPTPEPTSNSCDISKTWF